MKILKLFVILTLTTLFYSSVFADYNSLKDAIKDYSTSIKEYSLTENEIVNEDLGGLNGTELTILGNEKDIIANLVIGIQVFTNQRLYIENVNNISNFFKSDNGAAIYSLYGSVTIGENILFSSNTVYNENKSVYGGAIYNERGDILIKDDSKFCYNQSVVTSSSPYGGSGRGGAIANMRRGTINLLNDIEFINNTSNNGGAIFNGNAIIVDDVHYYPQINIGNNVLFFNNNAIPSYFSPTISSAGSGGAIANYGNMNISNNVVFSSNTATFSGGSISNYKEINMGDNIIFLSNVSENSSGGAIHSMGQITIAKNVKFSSNTAKSYGGAIYNSNSSNVADAGNITLKDGAIFEYNKIINGNKISNGGAIYNNGNLNLIANTNNVEFTGNSVNGISNAIHDRKGTINLWASKDADVIFNDRITSEDNTSILNINSSTTTLIANGKVILNEDMSGYTGQVNLYGGEIELQAKTEEGSNVNTNKFFSGNINLSSGTLNILNNSIDNITVSNLTTTANSNLKFDTDLSNNTSDNFTITNSAIGELNLTAINILGTNGISGQITLFNDQKSPTLNLLTKANYDGYEYTFTNSETTGVLNYELTGTAKTFKEVINDTLPTIRSYSLSGNEIVTKNLEQLGGTQLTIFGNGYDINGNSNAGITVSEGQTLNIENVKEIKNFSSENHGGFINNAGTVNIGDNIILSSNTAYLRGGVIYNTGTINIGKNVSFSSNTLDGGGGAISNYEGNINIESNVSFINNSIVKETSHGFSGGAISNQYGTINIGSNAKFIQNFSTEGSGGAISNRLNSTIYIGSDAIFNMNDSGYYSGAVIYNDDTSSCYLGDNIEISSNIGDSIIHSQNILQIGKNVKFLFNEAGNSILTSFGQSCTIEKGAEFNSNKGASVISNNGTLELKEGSNFISNQTSNGTLVNSKNCTIGSNSIFSLNILSGTSPYSGHGGAISNSGTLKVDYNAIFSSNTAKGNVEVYGGAIYNTGSLIISSTTKFEFNNSVTSGDYINRGGAIYNNGFCDIGEDVSFISNETRGDNQDGACGGAIYSEGKIQIAKNAKFDNNNSTHGGAIFSTSDLNIDENVTFKGNNSTKNGGAIFSTGNTIIGENATFQDNMCNEKGGAIKSFGITTILNGANFISNISNCLGGAIHNEGVLNLTANTVNIEFNGNMANGVSNAIHDDKGTINLWASDSADIVFNDRITSEDNTSVLNINSPNTTLNAIGKIVLNEDMSGYNGTVNLYDGTIKLGEKGTLFSGDMFVDNATIDMANNVIKENNLKKLTINNNLNIVVDADLQTEEMDTMYIDSFEGDGKVNIRGVNILSDNNKNETTEILFTSSTVLKNKITSVKTVSSKLFKYVLSYNDGYFKFRNVGDSTDSNPIILESSVAGMASGLITQTTVLNQAFSSIDNIRNRITQAKQKGLLYASTADVVFNNSEIESGLWIRPFMAQDTIKLDSLDVDNTLTGTLAGLDLATGENSLVSFYLGYAGSNQKYEDIKVNQTGYIVGATGMLIKDKWYAGITANINFNKAESESDYGTDSFDLNMYSIGAKAGYNFEIGSNWIIEPNLTLMYGNISNQEYETTQGAKIDSQSNSNIIVEPQVKAKLDLTNGWQPYGLLGYVANISDKGKVVADEIEFETDKIDGYVEYGAGINKEFINTPWSCYAQVTGRNGGINGFSGNIGIKYKF